jgi:mannose-1-phosphate guanylyltransferase
MKLMLFCAGEGLRLRPYTDILPKPCIPFLNLPLALWSVRLAHELNISQIIYNTYHLPKAMNTLMHTYRSHLPQTTEVPDGAKLLGGGGGLFNCRKHFLDEENFVVANGDSVLLTRHLGQISRAFKEHQQNELLATLICVRHPGAGVQFGAVWADDTNNVLSFGKEAPTGNPTPWHFTGYMILNRKIFSFLHEGESNLLYDALAAAIRKMGECARVYEVDGIWFETGNWSDFAAGTRHAITEMVRDPRIHDQVADACAAFGLDSQFVTTTTASDGTLSWVSKNAQISESVLVGYNAIGNSAIRNSTIESSVVGHSLIVDHCKLRNQMVLQTTARKQKLD